MYCFGFLIGEIEKEREIIEGSRESEGVFSSSSLFLHLHPLSPAKQPQKKQNKANTHRNPLRAARRYGRVDRRGRHQRPPGGDRRRSPGPAGNGVPAVSWQAVGRVGAGGGSGRADSLVDHAREAGGRVGCRGGVGALGATAGELLRGEGGWGGVGVGGVLVEERERKVSLFFFLSLFFFCSSPSFPEKLALSILP